VESLLDKFNQVDLNGKAVLIWENGEFISTRKYYSMLVNLYTLPGFIVEVFYYAYLNKIKRIEVVTDDKLLNQHLDQIGITDIFR
jgi:hypothetical protein